jgi:hypothetical protein
MGVGIGACILAMELWINLSIWKMSNVVTIFWWQYYDADRWTVKTDLNDPKYVWLVFGGLAISLLTIAGLGAASWLETRRAKGKKLQLPNV